MIGDLRLANLEWRFRRIRRREDPEGALAELPRRLCDLGCPKGTRRGHPFGTRPPGSPSSRCRAAWAVSTDAAGLAPMLGLAERSPRRVLSDRKSTV